MALQIADSTRCVQETEDTQKPRILPHVGETKVQPYRQHHSLLSETIAHSVNRMLFGTQVQSGQVVQYAKGLRNG